jgi:molybdenum cofactor synthesis domain-containing protein
MGEDTPKAAMMQDQPVTACVIIIGNEILSGRTRDANLVYLATALGEIGIRLMEARVIRDDEDAIVATVNACRSVYDYVFTTGGIGPTHDDITAASIAKAFAVPLIRHPQAMALLSQHYRPDEFNEARQRMADIPEGAELIDNPVSRAPGFQIANVFVLPGVPMIMRAMFDGLRPRLKGGAPVLSRTISAYTTEGSIAAALTDIQARHPLVEIGSYPFIRSGRFGVSLVVRSANGTALDDAAADVRAMLQAAGAAPIEDDQPAEA